MYASRFGYVNPAITGFGLELTVIAAVVIGGTSITGGTGSVAGTLLGCLLLGLISTSLPILGVAGSWQFGIYGAIIVIALVIDRLVLSSSSATTQRVDSA
jgi:rhamnose transport system permease protein